jgi:hypothetical protein
MSCKEEEQVRFAARRWPGAQVGARARGSAPPLSRKRRARPGRDEAPAQRRTPSGPSPRLRDLTQEDTPHAEYVSPQRRFDAQGAACAAKSRAPAEFAELFQRLGLADQKRRGLAPAVGGERAIEGGRPRVDERLARLKDRKERRGVVAEVAVRRGVRRCAGKEWMVPSSAASSLSSGGETPSARLRALAVLIRGTVRPRSISATAVLLRPAASARCAAG